MGVRVRVRTHLAGLHLLTYLLTLLTYLANSTYARTRLRKHDALPTARVADHLATPAAVMARARLLRVAMEGRLPREVRAAARARGRRLGVGLGGRG